MTRYRLTITVQGDAADTVIRTQRHLVAPGDPWTGDACVMRQPVR